MTYHEDSQIVTEGPEGRINYSTPSTPGTTLQRFGRSYVYYQPSGSTTEIVSGTWNLMYESEADGDSNNPYEGVQRLSVIMANPNNEGRTLLAGTLIYIGNDGLGYLSKADAPETARVAGALIESSQMGSQAYYARNAVIDIFNTEGVIEGDPGTLIPNTYYYLSSTNAGEWTPTPDTTTDGLAVLQCGLAINVSRMAVEIQQATFT
jgi:hypothetical protein